MQENAGERITEPIMEFIMLFQLFMLQMETHIRGIRMPLQILIKIISRQKSSQEFWEGKLLRLKKYDMPAIMMTSIQRLEKKLRNKLTQQQNWLKNRRIRLERDGIIVFVSFMKYLWRFLKSKMHQVLEDTDIYKYRLIEL